MGRKRPCRICGHWFRPHPRAGDRQQVCSGADCQRERHRRACQRWRQREGPAERAHRLRQRLRKQGDGRPGVVGSRVAWEAVRDAVGRQVRVSAAELRQVQLGGGRDDMVLAERAP